MKELIPYILALLAGIFTTLESDLNAQLGRVVNPKTATFHSLFVGTLIFLIALFFNGSLRQYPKVFDAKPSLLIGGFFGAFIIYFVTLAIPKLGITTTLTLVIVAQVLSSLYIDTYVAKQSLNPSQLIGVILAVAGVYFIVR